MGIRAQDLPEIRADIADWLNSSDAASIWRKALMTGYLDWIFKGPVNDVGASVIRGNEINRLNESHLFHVAADMVELATAASRSIPHFELVPEDLPTKAGLMVFDQIPARLTWPEGESVGVRAVCWAPIPNGRDNTLLITRYLDRSEVAPLINRSTVYRNAFQEPSLIYAHGGEFIWAFGRNDASPDADSGLREFVKFMRATWLLMQQPIARESEAEPNRAARKRLIRMGHEPAPVRVIELRRPKGSSEHSDSDREYHHQWIVRGHWRQHWHPKRQVHRPVWIAPHIKGPEGAPLIGGEKVYAWKR